MLAFYSGGPPNGGVAVGGMFEVRPKARPIVSPVLIPKRLPTYVSLSPLALTMEKNVNIMEKLGKGSISGSGTLFC
jgi:hypothetical protein